MLIIYEFFLVLFIVSLSFLFIFENNLFFLKNSFKFFIKDLFGLEYKFFLSVFYSSVVFFIVYSFCFVGYFSYSYALLALVDFTFVLAIVSWLATLLNFFFTESVMIYFTKSGEGFFQTMLMFFIELASELSRPFSLTVRLTVNIMIGHLISLGVQNLILIFSLNYSFVYLLATALEMFVFLVQSYVFSRLLQLYLNE